MNYLLATNNSVLKFPYSLEELRSDNPQTSFAWEMSREELAEWGVFPVEEQNPPAYNEQTESIELQPPTVANGIWKQVWLIVAASAVVIDRRTKSKALQMRLKRDQSLTATDYTQLPDFQGSNALQLSFKLYRQHLRELPQQDGFPFNTVWPDVTMFDVVT